MYRLLSGFLGMGLALALMLTTLPAWTASAAIVGTASITSASSFSTSSGVVQLNVTASNSATGTGTPTLFIRTRLQPSTDWLAADAWNTNIPVPYSGGSFSGTVSITLPVAMIADGNKVDLRAVIEDAAPADITTTPPAAQATVTVDSVFPVGWAATAPLFSGDAADGVYCASFLMYGVAKDVRSGIGTTAVTSSGITTTRLGASALPNEAVLFTDLNFDFTASTVGLWTFQGSATDNAKNKAVASLFSKNASTTACKSFSDISGHFSARHARYLASAGTDKALFAGNPDGTFTPDRSLTRGELATTLVRAAGLTPDSTPNAACTFTDVKSTDWFHDFVTAACQAGLMTGLGGGLFGPNDEVTRGQAAVAVNNLSNLTAAGWLPGSVISVPSAVAVVRTAVPFSDVTVGAFYATAVTNLYGRAIVNGTSATTYSPDQILTRGELAVILYRALGQAAVLTDNS